MADICWSGWLCIGQEGQLMLEEGLGCVGGAVSHFVVEQVFSRAFEEAMRWCACGVMEAGYCVLVHARLSRVERMLPCRRCGSMQNEAHRHDKHCSGFGSCSPAH